MGASSTTASFRRLPQVVAAALVVVGLPIVAASLLRESGVVTSSLLLVAVAMTLSVVASYAGAAFWATRPGAGDTLFGDLMLWGWLRRRRMERQLAGAVELLGLRDAAGDDRAGELLSRTRRTRLLERLGRALEARSPETHGHSRRVARHSVAIAKRMGLPDEEVARIRTAAAVHDVGKVETPTEILTKPGPLTDGEFAVIKLHPVVGARMVAKLGDPELTRIVRHHHERLDGTGYPDGLAAERIPLGARIVAVADTFDAVTSARSYRPARTHKEGLALLADVFGTQLDPDAVRAFRAYYSGFRPVAIWALFLNGSRQLFASFGGEGLRAGNLALAAKATAATAATAVTLAAGSVTAEALRTDGASSGNGESQQAVSRFDPSSAGDAQSPGGLSNSHGSNQQGSGIDSNGAGPGSSAADQREAGSGSQSGSSQSGSSQSDGGGSTSTDTSGSTSSGGDTPVSVPDPSTPPTHAGAAHDVVAGAADSLPAIPVPIPPPPDVHSVVSHLPGLGNGHR